MLTLEDALRTAREKQPQLRQARAGTLAAKARSDEAKSQLLPQVQASAGYQRTTGNIFTRPGVVSSGGGAGATAGSTSSFDTFNYFSSGITANQLLYDFGQTTGRWHSQEAQARATEDTEHATRLAIALQVRAAFFDARANKDLVTVARDTWENLKKHLEQIEAFVAAGTRPDIDVFQARSDAANAQVQLINSENAYATSRANLNQAMGVESTLEYDVADEQLAPVEGEDAAIDPLLTEAVKARPELAALEEQVRAQLETLRSVEGQYGPSISAQAGFTQGGVSLAHYGWNASLGLALTWNLYQGGLTNATVREAEANAASTSAQLEVQKQAVRLELEQVRLAVRAAKGTLGASREALDNAKQRLALAEGRYENGIGNIIELGDAQVALTTAAAQVVQANFRLATARAQLIKALGRP